MGADLELNLIFATVQFWTICLITELLFSVVVIAVEHINGTLLLYSPPKLGHAEQNNQ